MIVPSATPHTEVVCEENASGEIRRVQCRDLGAIEKGDIDYLNCLHSAGVYVADNYTWHWVEHSSDTVDHWVSLRDGDDRIYLGLNAARVDQSIDFNWRECCGDIQLVAWAASFHYVLSMVQHVYQRDWIPEALFGGDDLPEACVETRFVVETDTQRVAIGRTAATRPLRPQATTSIVERNWLNEIPVAIPLVVDRLWLSADELQNLEVGSVICIRRRAFLDIGARLTLRAGNSEFLAKIVGSQVVILRTHYNTSSDHFQKENAVTDNNITQDFVPVEVESMPVELSFRAGSLTTSYAQLRNVQPGYIFELEQSLREKSIEILANGALVGRGELVAIGDQIGVRLTALGATCV